MNNTNNHDHDSSTHVMACPVCSEDLKVHAHDDNEAVPMLIDTAKKHFQEKGHPMDPSMTEEAMTKMTKESIKKMEA